MLSYRSSESIFSHQGRAPKDIHRHPTQIQLPSLSDIESARSCFRAGLAGVAHRMTSIDLIQMTSGPIINKIVNIVKIILSQLIARIYRFVTGI